MAEITNNCCDNEPINNFIKLKLIGKFLWVTVGGITASVDLTSLSTGSGTGEGGEMPDPIGLILPVSSNGQTLFSQVIPENAIVIELIVNSGTYTQEGGSFEVDGSDIIWTNEGFDLDINDTVILKLWQP